MVEVEFHGGKGPRLLLLHSGFSLWVEWRRVIEVLSSDFELFAPTLPGSVGAPALRTGLWFREQVDFVEGRLGELGWGAGVTVAGSSFGGCAAVELLARGRVDRAVVHTFKHAATELAEAQALINQAFALAGFNLRPTKRNGYYVPLFDPVGILEHFWEFRRYGLNQHHARLWFGTGFKAPAARVFIDAGYGPHQAANLAATIQRHLQNETPRQDGRELFAATILAVLDHPRLPAKRALAYLQAGVRHDEISQWERDRRRGEDVDGRLAFLTAMEARDHRAHSAQR